MGIKYCAQEDIWYVLTSDRKLVSYSLDLRNNFKLLHSTEITLPMNHDIMSNDCIMISDKHVIVTVGSHSTFVYSKDLNLLVELVDQASKSICVNTTPF